MDIRMECSELNALNLSKYMIIFDKNGLKM